MHVVFSSGWCNPQGDPHVLLPSYDTLLNIQSSFVYGVLIYNSQNFDQSFFFFFLWRDYSSFEDEDFCNMSFEYLCNVIFVNLKPSLFNCRERSTALFLTHNEIKLAIAIKKIKIYGSTETDSVACTLNLQKSGKKWFIKGSF